MDGLRAIMPADAVATNRTEANSIFLLLITKLVTNLTYLWLEGTLSVLVIFQDSKLTTIRRIVIDV
jgi:hypothetical protein